MSELDYSTIHRTPLSQLHTLPLELLCVYVMQCPQVSRQALARIIKVS